MTRLLLTCIISLYLAVPLSLTAPQLIACSKRLDAASFIAVENSWLVVTLAKRLIGPLRELSAPGSKDMAMERTRNQSRSKALLCYLSHKDQKQSNPETHLYSPQAH